MKKIEPTWERGDTANLLVIETNKIP